MKKVFGFIGCGNMGGALARAVLKTLPGEQVLLCDAQAEKTAELCKLGAKSVDLETLALTADYVILGVKPQGLEGLFKGLRGILENRKKPLTLISMAAGTAIEKIVALAGKSYPVIRIMPNTPASVGEGMILYTVGKGVEAEAVADFCEAFSKAGRLDEIAEDKIDAASAVSGCGPAFAFLFAEALADGGVECGLPRDKANLYAAQMLLGSAKLLLESGEHPGKLKDAVCSPGGTTIEGVRALEENSFRGTVMDAVGAAYRKTLKL